MLDESVSKELRLEDDYHLFLVYHYYLSGHGCVTSSSVTQQHHIIHYNRHTMHFDLPCTSVRFCCVQFVKVKERNIFVIQAQLAKHEQFNGVGFPNRPGTWG